MGSGEFSWWWGKRSTVTPTQRKEKDTHRAHKETKREERKARERRKERNRQRDKERRRRIHTSFSASLHPLWACSRSFLTIDNWYSSSAVLATLLFPTVEEWAGADDPPMAPPPLPPLAFIRAVTAGWGRGNCSTRDPFSTVLSPGRRTASAPS